MCAVWSTTECANAVAGYGHGCSSGGNGGAESLGICHPDDGVLLPADGDSRDYLCRASEWQTASWRLCRGASRLEQCEDLVLGIIWHRAGRHLLLDHAGRAWY